MFVSVLAFSLTARAAPHPWERSGIGGAVALSESGDVAGGPILTTLGGDLNIYVLFGGEDERYSAVRAWAVDLGTFVPSFVTADRTGKNRKKAAAEKAAAAVAAAAEKASGEEAPPAGPKVLVGTPRLKVGGSAWRSERFRVELGGTGLVDLLALARVPATTAYLGPTFGGRSQVVYLDGGAAGTGALLLTGGLAAGAALGPSILRLDSVAELDPFVLGVDLKAAMLLGFSLNRLDVPLSFRIQGDGTVRPATGWEPEWTAMGTALFTVD